MRYSDLVRVFVAVAVAIAATPALAKSPTPKVKVKPVTSSAKPSTAKAKVKAPKAQAAKPKAAAKPTTSSAKPKASSSKPNTSAGGAPQKPGKGGNKADDATPVVSSADPTSDPAPVGTLSKAQEKLAQNDKLRAKMESRLPGMDIMAAAGGFKNLGQFIAAVNVSNNLDIPFTVLKRLMVGEQQLSLGQAIQQAKAMEATRATALANDAIVQANGEISATSSVKKVKVKG